MADSIRERILQAVITALGSEGLPEDVTVDRLRRRPLELEELPRISVYPRDEQVKRATSNRTSPLSDRTMRIAVVARVNGTDDALDPLSQWIIAALLKPPRAGEIWFLRGLALAIDEVAVDWEADEDSQADYSVAATMIEIRYITRREDLTAA